MCFKDQEKGKAGGGKLEGGCVGAIEKNSKTRRNLQHTPYTILLRFIKMLKKSWKLKKICITSSISDGRGITICRLELLDMKSLSAISPVYKKLWFGQHAQLHFSALSIHDELNIKHVYVKSFCPKYVFLTSENYRTNLALTCHVQNMEIIRDQQYIPTSMSNVYFHKIWPAT